MLDVAIMIEGQNGLTWPRWQAIARAVEDLGFAGLYRSDHFTNSNPPDIESLECWISLAWLAGHTRRIAFGPLVLPFSFRHPVHVARMAAAVDDLSGGRLRLGLGAGWQAREHASFGFPLLEPEPRFARCQEGVEVVTRLLRQEPPVDFEGRYYQLQGASLLPRPARPGGPPIIIGGNGPRRTLPLAARYADEWNATFQTPERYAALSAQLDDLLRARGREPSSVRRTLMTNLLLGRDDADLEARLRGRDVAALKERGVVVGTPAAVADQLTALEAAGVQGVMLQWLDLDDVAGLEVLARAVL